MAGKNLSSRSLAKLEIATLEPDDKIAKNFQFYELFASETAARQHINNNMTEDDTLRAAVNLARKVLQPIRDEFGSFSPNSVYRSQALERALKRKPMSWISGSQHTMGCACDVEIAGVPTLDLAEWASINIAKFDQIICECYDPRNGPNSGWVHISMLPPTRHDETRGQLLSYIADPQSGRYIYVNGLQTELA